MQYTLSKYPCHRLPPATSACCRHPLISLSPHLQWRLQLSTLLQRLSIILLIPRSIGKMQSPVLGVSIPHLSTLPWLPTPMRYFCLDPTSITNSFKISISPLPSLPANLLEFRLQLFFILIWTPDCRLYHLPLFTIPFCPHPPPWAPYSHPLLQPFKFRVSIILGKE